MVARYEPVMYKGPTAYPVKRKPLSDEAAQLAAATGGPPIRPAGAMTATSTTPPTATDVALAPIKQGPAGDPSTAPKDVPTEAAPAKPLIQPTTYSPAVQEMLDILKGKTANQPISYTDIENSAEYKAMQARNELKRGEAQAQLRRGLSSRGMLRSTPSVQTLASSDAYYTAENAANEQQMVRDAFARQQTELANMRGYLSDVLGVENQSFNQGVTQFNTTAPYTMKTIGQQIQEDQFNAGATGMLSDGTYTLSGRADEAALTGIDPVTGKPTYGQTKEQIKAAREKELDDLLIEQRKTQNKIEALKLQAAQTTDPNAAAKAALALRELELNNQKLEADITRIKAEANAANALANERNTSPAKEPKKPQSQIDAEKRTGDLVDSYRADYNVSRDGSEGWVELVDVWSSTPSTAEQKYADLNHVINNKPGLTAQDQTWLWLMFDAGVNKNAAAQERLNKPPFRDKDINAKKE